MSNTLNKFDYVMVKMDRKDNEELLPFVPFVEITLKQWGTSSYHEAPSLSGQLITHKEIDDHVQALKEDLDAVGKRAKDALTKSQEGARSYKSLT